MKSALISKFGDSEYLNVEAFLPSLTRKGYKLNVCEFSDKLMVWYKAPNYVSYRFFFKRFIKFDESFVTCLGLSLGDGLNNPSVSNSHYNFVNTNFDLVFLIYEWLRGSFGFEDNAIQMTLRYPSTEITPDISNVKLNFGCRINLYKDFRSRHKSLVLQISNTIFQQIYSSLFNKLNETILNNELLRRAFLKGLFAAEGHVKHSTYGTLESMSFSYNPYLEQKLISFVKKCLEAEGINAKDNKKGLLYFCSYESMLRFHFMGGLSLHKAKEEKFIWLLKNAEAVLHFKDGYLMPLRKHSQHELAKSLSCSQPTICTALKENFFPLRYLLKLHQDLDVSQSALLAATEFATIRTSFVRDKESIRLLLSLLIEPSYRVL